jgi:hypothetical protein
LVQVVPLRVNAAGTPLVPVAELPLRPKLTLPPAGIVAVHDSLVAVTWRPLWVARAFQMLLMVWLAGRLQVSVQPLIAEAPALVTVNQMRPDVIMN